MAPQFSLECNDTKFPLASKGAPYPVFSYMFRQNHKVISYTYIESDREVAGIISAPIRLS